MIMDADANPLIRIPVDASEASSCAPRGFARENTPPPRLFPQL